jgi:glycine cleavage system aminomethyltransferase T
VTALDFLSPGLADPSSLARSSMERAQRDAGALFSERRGWLVPVTIPGEDEHLASVGVVDLSHLGKLEIRPSREPVEADDVVWYRVSPRRTLVLGPADRVAAVREQLTGSLVVDVTAQLGILALAGPAARTALRRMTHLHHFPSGGEVAHVTAHVLERRGGYWIVFPQELGHYLWEVAIDRCRPFGGGPVGVDAYERGAA